MRPRYVVLPAILVVLACGDTEPESAPRASESLRQERVSISPPPLAPELRALVDEGNTAFEAGDYDAAIRNFEAAIAADSSSASAWFGAYMTWIETGDAERASEARSRIETLARPRFGDPHAVPPAGDGGAMSDAAEVDEASDEGMVDETSQLEGGT